MRFYPKPRSFWEIMREGGDKGRQAALERRRIRKKEV
jgi:hypothetical protein